MIKIEEREHKGEADETDIHTYHERFLTLSRLSCGNSRLQNPRVFSRKERKTRNIFDKILDKEKLPQQH